MNRLIVGLSGPKYVGKSTVADHLERCLGFRRLSMATPLKDMMLAVFGIDYNGLSSIEKESPHPGLGNNTPRQVLQSFGDYLKSLDDAVLVKIMRRKIAHSSHPVVIDDIRRDDEAVMVKELGGVVLRVARTSHQLVPDTHPTEHGIGEVFIDATLDVKNHTPESPAFSRLIERTLKPHFT